MASVASTSPNNSQQLPPSSQGKKVLLMGRAGAGKTSMRSIIFANYLARDTKQLTATSNVEHSHFRFLGNLVLSLWDCGGQDTFMENYFESQREQIFRNAEALIYVLEVRTFVDAAAWSVLPPHQQQHKQQQTAAARMREIEKDLKYFKTTAESVKQYSPNAWIFCLVHKMDLLLKPLKKSAILQEYEVELGRLSAGLNMRVYGTSIWDETLYKAWSAIVYSLIPNVGKLEGYINRFCDATGADEVVLFERSTFLVIGKATRIEHQDSHRFEKISNICKQFKLTCGKTQSNFSNLFVKVPSFTAFIERFTQNTYILLVISDKEIPTAAVLCNIDYAREQFEKLAESMKLGPTL